MAVVVQQEQLEPCKVALEVEVPAEQFRETVDRVFNRMAKRTQVPGFRPGKAPRRLVERFINQDRVQEMALEQVVTEGYREALEQTGLRPFSDPALEVGEREEGEPVTFRVTIPLAPSAELGDYRSLTFTRLQTEITDEDVDAELDRARQDAARYEDVEEAAQEGDRILATVALSIDGEPLAEASFEKPTWLQLGANLEEFDREAVGIQGGDERLFHFTYPDDFAVEDRRGKRAEARLNCVKVQRRMVPELDDDFAKGLGYDDTAALRDWARESLRKRAAAVADEELDREILREIVARSSINFPEEMTQHEVANDVAALVKRLEQARSSLTAHLARREIDLQTLEGEYSERARRRITNSLALMAIARHNEIQVEDADVDAEIERRATATGVEPGVLRRVLEDRDELEDVGNAIFFRKVMDYLKRVNTIEEKAG